MLKQEKKIEWYRYNIKSLLNANTTFRILIGARKAGYKKHHS